MATTWKACFIILNAIFLFACASAPQDVVEVIDVRAPSKLTRSKPTELRLGVMVKTFGAEGPTAISLAQAFEAQLELFSSCQEKMKTLNWHAEVSWVSALNGLLSEVQIERIIPDNKDLKGCVLIKLADIDLGKQSQIWRGTIIVGSFEGETPPWKMGKQRILQ